MRAPLAQPAREPPRPPLEELAAAVEARLQAQPEEVRREYDEKLYMSWIHHDSALEGVVYTFQELQMAIDPAITVVPDSSIQPICDEIRRHKEAIDFVRETAAKKRQAVTTDIIKRVYLILHPDEGDLKTVKYRKDIPQHRLYFHEYAPPDKIAYGVRQVVDWTNDPETRRTRTPIRIAARAHYDLLRVFPFQQDSGKVARLLMNFILLRAGFPPAILHATERQRYYEALKGSPLAIVHMVQEALENSIASIEKFLDERTTRVRAFVS
jgi:Fic family protein